MHPDGKKLVVCGLAGVSIADIEKRHVLWHWQSPGPIEWAEFAADSRRLFLLNDNHTTDILRLNQFGVPAAKVVAPNPPAK